MHSTLPLCTGILLIIYPTTSFLWILFVIVMFWKMVFPSNSLRYRYLDKWIHALTTLISEHNYYSKSIYIHLVAIVDSILFDLINTKYRIQYVSFFKSGFIIFRE